MIATAVATSGSTRPVAIMNPIRAVSSTGSASNPLVKQAVNTFRVQPRVREGQRRPSSGSGALPWAWGWLRAVRLLFQTDA